MNDAIATLWSSMFRPTVDRMLLEHQTDSELVSDTWA